MIFFTVVSLASSYEEVQEMRRDLMGCNSLLNSHTFDLRKCRHALEDAASRVQELEQHLVPHLETKVISLKQEIEALKEENFREKQQTEIVSKERDAAVHNWQKTTENLRLVEAELSSLSARCDAQHEEFQWHWTGLQKHLDEVREESHNLERKKVALEEKKMELHNIGGFMEEALVKEAKLVRDELTTEFSKQIEGGDFHLIQDLSSRLSTAAAGKKKCEKELSKTKVEAVFLQDDKQEATESLEACWLRTERLESDLLQTDSRLYATIEDLEECQGSLKETWRAQTTPQEASFMITEQPNETRGDLSTGLKIASMDDCTFILGACLDSL